MNLRLSLKLLRGKARLALPASPAWPRGAAAGRRGVLGDAAGAVAVELAVALPFLLLLIVGVIDFSAYMNSSQEIAAATRVGAEFARDSTVCRKSATGINYVGSGPTILTPCTTAISTAVQSTFAYNAADITASAALACYCDAASTTACPPPPNGGGYGVCATGQNRVFVTVSATQAGIAPMIPYSQIGIPATLRGRTQVQIQ